MGKKRIYILDSSVWIECNEREGDNRIPILLQKLLSEGRVKCPKEVLRELIRSGVISDWAKGNRAAIRTPHGMPPEYATNLGAVQFQFPAMGKARGSRERADPYVVALALTNRDDKDAEWIVVTGESRKNRPRRKIPGACDELGLPCIGLDDLLKTEIP